MFKKIIQFIKYNNLMVLILLAAFIFGAGVLAQTEAGQEAIGVKKTGLEGLDNTLLLEADLDNFDMNFRIEKIEEDEEYYYVIFTYLDLVKHSGAWQYQAREKTRKISKKLRKDLGEYLAEQLKAEYEFRLKDLKTARAKASLAPNEGRYETIKYSGLIGRTLDAAGRIFPGYEPVKKRELPAPKNLLTVKSGLEPARDPQTVDDLEKIYHDYMAKLEQREDNEFNEPQDCPAGFVFVEGEEEGVEGFCLSLDESSADQATTSQKVIIPSEEQATTSQESDLSASPEQNFEEDENQEKNNEIKEIEALTEEARQEPEEVIIVEWEGD